jgi:ketose-bisphosphate aldolase
MMLGTADLMRNAWKAGTAIPAFNIPYLPMMEPTVRALRDARCFGLIAVARLEWVKFEAGSPRDVLAEYDRVKDESFTRLHLDHVPVVDEDGFTVNYDTLIAEAINLGYQSVMVDGSRLAFDDNIAATKRVVDMAHAAGVPVEAELGAVLGHESGPLPPYEELFESGKGFTDPDEAQRFVAETAADWLSVAIGNIHGAISAAKTAEKKAAARLSIERLDAIREATNMPLVLHGGTGIRTEYLLEAFKHGIAKINIGTATRQAYESAVAESPDAAQEAVHNAALTLLRDELELEGSVDTINPGNG